MKKTLAVVLALALCLCCFTVFASADAAETVYGIKADYVNAVFKDGEVVDTNGNMTFAPVDGSNTVVDIPAFEALGNKIGELPAKLKNEDGEAVEVTVKGAYIKDKGSVRGTFTKSKEEVDAMLANGYTIEVVYMSEVKKATGQGIFCGTDKVDGSPYGIGLATKGWPYMCNATGSGWGIVNGSSKNENLGALNHVIAIYDAEANAQVIFLNGELVIEANGSGAPKISSNEWGNQMHIGGDPNNGVVDFQSLQMTVCAANIYTQAFSDEDAARAYEAAVARVLGKNVVDLPYGEEPAPEVPSEEPTEAPSEDATEAPVEPETSASNPDSGMSTSTGVAAVMAIVGLTAAAAVCFRKKD